MSTTTRSRYLFFFLLMGTLFTYAISRTAISATVVKIPAVSLLILCAGSVALFYVVLYNRWTAIGALSLLAFSALAIYIYLRRTQFEAEWFIGTAEYFNEVALFIRGFLPYKEQYMLPFGLGLTGSVGLLTALCLKFRPGFYLLTAFGAAVFGIQAFMGYNRSDMALTLFVFCFVVLAAKELNLLAGGVPKAKASSNLDFSLMVIPAGLVIVAITFFMPKPEPVTDGHEFVQNTRERFVTVEDFFYEAFSPKFFSFQSAGISNRPSRLGGNLMLSNRHIMEVHGDERVYLSAAIRDIYTGDSWITSRPEQDTVAHDGNGWYHTNSYSEELREAQREVMTLLDRPVKRLSINTVSTRTRMLFSPPFEGYLWFPGNAPVRQAALGNLSAGELLERNLGYVQEYISWDYEDADFKRLMREFSSDSTESREVQGSAHLLQIPETVPGRVRELAAGLTAGLDNDYDRMKALEEHLMGYQYSLDPGDLPDGEDFVDYFLFGSKEGYCTYYASALAVLGRAAGVPTRYLEGYVMPPSHSESGGYSITNFHAHAWTEAYIHGFGWIPFEGTPLYNTNFFGGDMSNISRMLSYSMSDGHDLEYYMHMLGYDLFGEEFNDIPALNPGGRNAVTGENTPAPVRLEWIIIILGAAPVLFLSYLAFQVALTKQRMRRIEGMANRDAVIAYFAQILKVAAAYGYPIKSSETAYTYAQRVGNKFMMAGGTQFAGTYHISGLAQIFSRASYSKNDISDGERELMRNCHEEMLGRHRAHKMNRSGYLFNRYVLARF